MVFFSNLKYIWVIFILSVIVLILEHLYAHVHLVVTWISYDTCDYVVYGNDIYVHRPTYGVSTGDVVDSLVDWGDYFCWWRSGFIGWLRRLTSDMWSLVLWGHVWTAALQEQDTGIIKLHIDIPLNTLSNRCLRVYSIEILSVLVSLFRW